jgi:hypothetical protein
VKTFAGQPPTKHPKDAIQMSIRHCDSLFLIMEVLVTIIVYMNYWYFVHTPWVTFPASFQRGTSHSPGHSPGNLRSRSPSTTTVLYKMSIAPSMPKRQLTTSSAPTTISFKQSALSSTTYRSAQTFRTSMAIKTDISCGTNLTAMSKSTYLLIDKQTPYTGNPHNRLDCSRHAGSLVPELQYFTVINKLQKVSLRTFGMQLTRHQRG